jgi:hypothetical protein
MLTDSLAQTEHEMHISKCMQFSCGRNYCPSLTTAQLYISTFKQFGGSVKRSEFNPKLYLRKQIFNLPT